MKSEKEGEELMNKSRKHSEEMKIKYNETRESVLKRQNLKKELEAKALLENDVIACISVEIATKNIKTINERPRLKVIDQQSMFYKHVILGGR